MSTTAALFPPAAITISSDPIAPILASSLLEDNDLDRLLLLDCALSSDTEKSHARQQQQHPSHLTTGFSSVDAALARSLETARVVELGGGDAAGGVGISEVSIALLVSFLLQFPRHTAAVVDTTGNFDVMRLYRGVVGRLKGYGPGKLDELRRDVGVKGEGVEEMAAKMLEQVKIMRVFDLEGVREALGEIEGWVRGERMEEETSEAGKVEMPKRKRTFVADSEDEDDGDEEEILFESEKKGVVAPEAQRLHTASVSKQDSPTNDSEGNPGKGTQSTLKFILIDNLAQVLGPMLKSDMIQGTMLSSALLSTLTHLTHTHALYTILVTPTTTTIPRAASPTRTVFNRPAHQSSATPFAEPTQQNREAAPHPSIFSSNKAVGMPALAALLGLYADVRLLVSRVPRRRADAKTYYAEEERVGAARKSRIDVVCVLEVVGDRWGGRTGAWGTFSEG